MCANMLLAFSSLVFLFLIFEFVVFRFVMPGCEMPDMYFKKGIIKYKPDQEGTYRYRNEIKSTFRINKNGWNSGHREYKQKKDKGKQRIAIIGDSYIRAIHVDYDKSIAEKLEELLGKDRFEVYRFGVSGAPMIQYLHMLRNEVLNFKPDIVIFTLVHNDIKESYKFKSGVYTSSFLKLKITEEGISEIPPEKYKERWFSPLRKSATWGFLGYRFKLQIKPIRDLILGKERKKTGKKEKKVNPSEYQANIDISGIEKRRAENILAVDYVLKATKEICDKENIRLIILFDGVKNLVYDHSPDMLNYKKGALTLNKITRDIAEKHSIDFIDLQHVFAEDYKKNNKRFSFITNNHWNEYGHMKAAEAVFAYLNDGEKR